MGVVYRARYVVNDREVAVKMIPDDVKNPQVLARFERELDVLKSLRHPNIVRTFGGVCEDKRRFYAMELIEGGSLEDQLQQRGRLPWEQVVAYGQQMCAALAHLHKHGVVHRDVKPANFLIGENEQLKLSDFGLASVITARRITTAGRTAGTILYMAPEQIQGGKVTPQTDLYALGCVLYELLTGTPPFFGSTPAATMNMHCRSPIPRVTQKAYDCPVALEQLITQLLAKNAEDRPADAETVARELARVTPTMTIVKKPRPIETSAVEPAAAPPSPDASQQYKETRDVSRTVTSQPNYWPLIGCAAVIAGLLAWNVHLRGNVDLAQRSEELWVQAAVNPQEPVRLNALESLGRLKTLTPETVEKVAQGLSDESPRIRQATAKALGEMGAFATAQIRVLRKAHTTDSREEVRVEAGAAIDRIQADTMGSGSGWLVALIVTSAVIALGAYLLRQHIRRLHIPPDSGSATADLGELALAKFQNR
jgi:serine/threonine-protein kinase